MKTVCLSLSLFLLAGCSTTNDPNPTVVAPAPTTTNGASTPSLDSAHQAYLDGDFMALGDRIRDVLLDSQSTDIVKQNAYQLLEKAYEVKGGSLPSSYVPPAGIRYLKFGVVNAQNGNGHFGAVYLYGQLSDPSQLASVKVKRLPDETILDSDNPSYRFDTSPDPFNPPHFILESIDAPAMPRDGVMSVRFTMKDGTTSESWFISHAQTSTATPELKTPAASATFREPPTVTWTPFHSPESAAFEQRTLSVWVSKDSKNATWNFWRQDYGDLASVKIGAQSTVTFDPGDYWFNVTCGESRTFGPFTLTRDSRTVQSFHLVP